MTDARTTGSSVNRTRNQAGGEKRNGREEKKEGGYVCDMDGVIYHGSRLIPSALEFVRRLQSRGHKFLFLTNNSQWTPRDLKHKLEQMGISVDEAAFHTSALATAEFLGRQKPGATAYVIGGAGLTHALYGVGFTLTENSPDYVVVGETRSYVTRRSSARSG